MPEGVCVGNVKVCTSNKTEYDVGKHLKWSWNLLCNIVDAGYVRIIHSLPPHKFRRLADRFHEGGGSGVLRDRVGVV